MDTEWLSDWECELTCCNHWAELLIKERKKLAACRGMLMSVLIGDYRLDEIEQILDETKAEVDVK